MSYEFLEHTADVRLHVFAKTKEGLFADSVAGLMELMLPQERRGASHVRHVSLAAPDLTALLIDFLGALLTQSHIRRERYDGIRFKQLSDSSLDAEIDAAPVSGFGRDVKAITYHEAQVREIAGKCLEITIVLDI